MINLNELEKTKKKVEFDLTSVDSNAFVLMGGFQKIARRAGWTPEEIGAVLMECRKGDYDHMVQTLIRFTD
jgi:hypothetical protein